MFLASLSLLLACRAAQAFELWLQQSGGVSPSRFFRNTSAPRVRKSLRKPHFTDHQQQATSEQLSKLLFWACPPAFNYSSKSRNSRDAIQPILPSSDVQRRVSMDVDGLQITAGVQKQLCDVHAAWECSPVKADVLFLETKHKPTITHYLILL